MSRVMALTGFGQLFRTRLGLPMVQAVRYKRPNTRSPRIPHTERALVLEVVKPKYPSRLRDVHPAETCENIKKFEKSKTVEINPFEQILAREFLEKVEESKVLIVFHQNSMTDAELYAIRLQLAKVGLYYRHQNNTIAKLAFTGTNYEALLQLYISNTVTFLGTDVKLAKFLKLQKKFRSLVLMAAVVEGRLMSVKDLEKFVAQPSLSVLHGQLVGILSTPVQRLSQNLTHHQRELSGALGRYVSDQSPSEKDSSAQELSTDKDAS